MTQARAVSDLFEEGAQLIVYHFMHGPTWTVGSRCRGTSRLSGRQGMMGGAKAHRDGIVAFSQADFAEDLTKITVPVLVMHGDDDQIVAYADSGPRSAQLLKNGSLKTYKGFPHGMPTTEAETIAADLLTFIKG